MAPITRVDHRPVGTESIGPNTSELRRLYLAATHGFMPAYRKWLLPVYQPGIVGKAA